MHVLCASDSASIVEYDLYDDSPLTRELLVEPLKAEDGYVELSDRPGLGIELNEEAVRRYRI